MVLVAVAEVVLLLFFLFYFFELHILHYYGIFIFIVFEYIGNNVPDKQQKNKCGNCSKRRYKPLVIGFAQLISTVVFIPTLKDDVKNISA